MVRDTCPVPRYCFQTCILLEWEESLHPIPPLLVSRAHSRVRRGAELLCLPFPQVKEQVLSAGCHGGPPTSIFSTQLRPEEQQEGCRSP